MQKIMNIFRNLKPTTYILMGLLAAILIISFFMPIIIFKPC